MPESLHIQKMKERKDYIKLDDKQFFYDDAE